MSQKLLICHCAYLLLEPDNQPEPSSPASPVRAQREPDRGIVQPSATRPLYRDGVNVVGVDERDSSWEDNDPRFRVYLLEGGDEPGRSWTTDTYDITGADVLEVVDWARDHAGDGVFAVALVRGNPTRYRGIDHAGSSGSSAMTPTAARCPRPSSTWRIGCTKCEGKQSERRRRVRRQRRR